MIIKFLKLTITLFFTFAINFSANAEIKVVASIKPIHSLVSYLMDGVGKPDLIVDGYNSPHGFALKPSHAKMLQNADLVFWVGEDLETFLEIALAIKTLWNSPPDKLLKLLSFRCSTPVKFKAILI